MKRNSRSLSKVANEINGMDFVDLDEINETNFMNVSIPLLILLVYQGCAFER